MTIKNMLSALVCLLLSTVIGFVFYEMKFSDTNIITVYILGVMVTAIITSSRTISFLQSAASVVVFNYFFTDPRFSLDTYDPGYPVTFVISFIAALITSNIALKMKTQARELAKLAYRTKIILDTNQLLQNGKTVEEIGNTMAAQLGKVLSHTVVYYGLEGEHLGSPVIYNANGEKDESHRSSLITENEHAVAEWVFKNNKRAGATTGTLSEAACYYLAVRSLDAVYGVVGIEIGDGEILSAYESNMLMAILSESATVMEREVLRTREEAATEKANSEKLRANLLRSISHDLRTPLNVPYFLFGHSMGSFMARRYIMTCGNELDGVIISGTGNQSGSVLKAGKIMVSLTKFFKGDRYRSKMLKNMFFSKYNDHISNVRTSNDWLTKDETIVDKYNTDKYCTYSFTVNGYRTLLDVLSFIQNSNNIAKIPNNLPVFLIAGEEDPVGNYGKAVKNVYEIYKKAGIKDISIKLYKNDRHELINETDKEDVYDDIRHWLICHL